MMQQYIRLPALILLGVMAWIGQSFGQNLPQDYVLFYDNFNADAVNQIFMQGPNQWTINKDYNGQGFTPDVADQTRTNTGTIINPNTSYLHIVNSGDGSLLNANYDPLQESDNTVIIAQNVCTQGFQKLEISFFWTGGGYVSDQTSAYAEVLYSLNGGASWAPAAMRTGNQRLQNSPNMWQYALVDESAMLNKDAVSFAIRWKNDRIDDARATTLSIGIDDFTIKATVEKVPKITSFLPSIPPDGVCAGGSIMVCFEHEWKLCDGIYAVEISDPGGQFTPPPTDNVIPYRPGAFYVVRSPQTTTGQQICINVPVGQFLSPDDCYRYRFIRVTKVSLAGLPFPANDLFGIPAWPPYDVGVTDPKPGTNNCIKVKDCKRRFFINTQPGRTGTPGSAPGVPIGNPPTFVSREGKCDLVCANSPLTISFQSWAEAQDPDGVWRQKNLDYDGGNEYVGEILRIEGTDTQMVKEHGRVQEEAIHPTDPIPGWGTIGGLVPEDLPDGCNYYLRVRSEPQISALVSIWGPFCIRHCDIETNKRKGIDICYSCNVESGDMEKLQKENNDYDWYICTDCAQPLTVDRSVRVSRPGPVDTVSMPPGQRICKNCPTNIWGLYHNNNTNYRMMNPSQAPFYKMLTACDPSMPGARVPMIVTIHRFPLTDNAPRVNYSPTDTFNIELWTPQVPPPFGNPAPLKANHDYPSGGDVDLDIRYGEMTFLPPNANGSQDAIIWLLIHPGGQIPRPGSYFFRIVSTNHTQDNVPGFPHVRPPELPASRPACTPEDNLGVFVQSLTIGGFKKGKLVVTPDAAPLLDCKNGAIGGFSIGGAGYDPNTCYEWYDARRPTEVWATTCPPGNGSIFFLVPQGATRTVRVREKSGKGCFGPFSDPATITIPVGPKLVFELDDLPEFCLGDTVEYRIKFNNKYPTQYTYATKFTPPDAGEVVDVGNNSIKIHWMKDGSLKLTVNAVLKEPANCEIDTSITFDIPGVLNPLQQYPNKRFTKAICFGDTFPILNMLPAAYMYGDDRYGRSMSYAVTELVKDPEFKYLPKPNGVFIEQQKVDTDPDPVERNNTTVTDRDTGRLNSLVREVFTFAHKDTSYFEIRTINETGCIIYDTLQLNVPPPYKVVGKEPTLCRWDSHTLSITAESLDRDKPQPSSVGYTYNWTALPKEEKTLSWEKTLRLESVKNDTSFRVRIFARYLIDPLNPADSLHCPVEGVDTVINVKVYMPTWDTMYYCQALSPFTFPNPEWKGRTGKWFAGPDSTLTINENKLDLKKPESIWIKEISATRDYKFTFQREDNHCYDSLRLIVASDPKSVIAKERIGKYTGLTDKFLVDRPVPGPKEPASDLYDSGIHEAPGTKALKVEWYPKSDAVIVFQDAAQGHDPAINEWFYKGDQISENSKDPTKISLTFQDSSKKSYIYLTVTNKYGCKDTTVDSIVVKNRYQITVYNVFTPNGDHANETFTFEPKAGIIEFQLDIYDRWGMKMFTTRNVNEEWNGCLFNDCSQKATEGTYFYVMKGKFNVGTEFMRSGNVTLLR